MLLRIFFILFLNLPTFIFANELAQNELQNLIRLAETDFNQHYNRGLSIQVELAKKLVLKNPELIRDISKRKLFLAQDSNGVANILCTVVSRYLYILAMRSIYKDDSPMPTFPEYYVLMVDLDAVTTDSSGKLFAWLKDGIISTEPFLPRNNWTLRVLYRSANFPTDGALISWMKQTAQPILFIRDSASSRAGSHSFLAVKNGQDYIMVDTWHIPFNGIKIDGSGPGPRPYLFRFGENGSRFLHNISGFFQE